MSTEPPSSAVSGGPAARVVKDGPAGARGVFALPASTSFRFALLIAAVVASSFLTYEGIYLATPRGPALGSLILRCRAQALAQHPSGAIALAAALGRAAVCYSGGYRTEAWWGLLGVGVLVVVAGGIFLAQPWWSRWRKNLTELTGADDADLVRRLEEVRQRAGTGPVVWLLQPLNARLSAFAFGRPGRRFVAVSGGAAVTAVRKPAAFEAVIMHELAHIKNRDIDQTYLALAIWRAFVVAALLPLAVVLIVSRVLGEPQLLIWRIAVLALIVYSLRNAILRSREFDADARARHIDPGIALGTVLAGLPARTGYRAWHLGWTHPSGREREAALADPAPLFRFGFWDGLAIGLVAALGATAVQGIASRLNPNVTVWFIVPAIIIAAFAGPALTVAMWRRQLREPDTGLVKGWAAGLGLGLGLAVGPVIAPLAAYDQALAPDHPSLASFGVLAVWTVLVVLIFTPFPVWVGHWADAWQQSSDPAAPRVPARGAMVAAAAAAWAVMAIGLYLLLQNFGLSSGQSSAADVWHGLPGLLRGTAIVIAQSASGWVVPLLVVGMSLAAAVAYRRWRRPADADGASVRRRRWLAPVWLGLAGCLAAIALLLAVDAFAHARVAEAVRWSPDFVTRLGFFDEQAIVVIAVVCALIVAAWARSAVGVALAVVVGAAVAAAGGLAWPTVLNMGYCYATLSIEYAHPPAGGCLTSPGILILHTVVLGAALVSILVVPAAYAAGMWLRRRIARESRPARVTALGWLAVAVAVVAAVAGTALWGASAIAEGVVKPSGSIGNDGWIRGYGYDVRLMPLWYALGPPGRPGLQIFFYPIDGGQIKLDSVVAADPVKVAAYRSNLLRLGARPDPLDGAPGLLLARSGLPGGVLEEWFVVQGPVVYLITLYGSPQWPQDSPSLENSYTSTLRSWRWTSLLGLRQSLIPATAAQLTRALLPVQALGAAATVRSSGTTLSDVSALCGAPLPSGARLTAYETLHDGQIGQYLQEVIIEFDNPGDAATLISKDRANLDRTGSCSWVSGGQKTEFTGDYHGSVPQECNNGQYVATQVSIQSALLSGFSVSAQCDSYTISVLILGGASTNSARQAADRYLNSAVGRLYQTFIKLVECETNPRSSRTGFSASFARHEPTFHWLYVINCRNSIERW